MMQNATAMEQRSARPNPNPAATREDEGPVWRQETSTKVVFLTGWAPV